MSEQRPAHLKPIVPSFSVVELGEITIGQMLKITVMYLLFGLTCQIMQGFFPIALNAR